MYFPDTSIYEVCHDGKAAVREKRECPNGKYFASMLSWKFHYWINLIFDASSEFPEETGCKYYCNRGVMKIQLFFILVAIAVCSSYVHAEELIPSDPAVKGYYESTYKRAKGHKAFAVGPYRAFGMAVFLDSAKTAEKFALKECKQNATRIGGLKPADRVCRIIDIDGLVFGRPPWPDLLLSPKSAKKSKALSNGRSSLAINGPAQGIVLHIHGCDGLGGDYFTGVWGQFFNSRGFYFFAPDSFADPRPAALCGRVANFNPLDEQKIQVTRIVQTLQSIEELKMRFPNLPIYLWGHSEGGIFIQFFSTDVAGIIVSGANCGISGGSAATFSGTPILFLIGDKDEFSAGIVAKPTAKKVAAECARRLTGIPHKVAYIVNQNHYLYPWRKQIYEPIIDFIKGKQMNLTVHYAPIDFILSNEQKAQYASYLRSKNHRAFAVTTKGVSRWQDHWEFNDDAEFGALADCATAIGTNLFTSSGSTECLIYDVNGKRKTRPLNTD